METTGSRYRSTGHRPAHDLKDYNRSAVTNGRRLHVTARENTQWSRRFKDVFAEIVNDMGGPDLLSEGQRQLIRRCTTLSIECEKLEGLAVLGGSIDLDLYGQMTDRLGRTLQRLGLRRVARNVNHDLKSYLRGRPDVIDAEDAE